VIVIKLRAHPALDARRVGVSGNPLPEMCSGSEVGSYLRLIDCDREAEAHPALDARRVVVSGPRSGIIRMNRPDPNFKKTFF